MTAFQRIRTTPRWQQRSDSQQKSTRPATAHRQAVPAPGKLACRRRIHWSELLKAERRVNEITQKHVAQRSSICSACDW
eukprot:2762532-Pleurochrysis_carterae.AAC.1